MDRLKRLVFSFYREDDFITEKLEPLKKCRLTRSWGSIRIDCLDEVHMEEISKLVKHLNLPFEALDLGHQIVLRVNGGLQRVYEIDVPFHTDQLA